MIEKLKLKNFMKHEDAEFAFTEGLQIVRGANEACKSGLLLSIGYALFGSRALRTNFSDVVTWGRPESSLKVELTITLAGRRLTFARGKSGAEVLEDGRVIVTGQNEVSAFAASLLGCDGAAASNLMIASQNALRGSLEQGPKATAAMIEQLSDFDLFDVLIERMQERLVVGAPATFEARLADAQARLDDYQETPAPDEAAHAAWLSAQVATADELQAVIDKAFRPAQQAAEKARDGAAQATRLHEEAQEELRRAERVLADHTDQVAAYKALSADTVPASALDEAERELERAENASATAQAYAAFKSLPTCQHEFEGDYPAFSTWLAARREDLARAREVRADLTTRIKVLEAQLVTSSVCGFCNQDVSAFPGVAEKNQRTHSQIDALRLEQGEVEKTLPEIEAEIKAGAEIENVARQVSQTLPRIESHVTVDSVFVPPRVTWVGEPPRAVDAAPARARVAELKRKIEGAREAKAKAEAMESILEGDRERAAQAQAKLLRCGLPENAEALHQAHIEAQEVLWNAESRVREIAIDINERKAAFQAAQAVYASKQDEHKRLQAALEQARKDLDDLAFNNALLKKVRGARPLIADKLWNTVLASVSTMFSQMRGEPSAVSKDNGGFKVNGQPIEALSGSTLDILGMALRTALVKTFIPHASFMLLDEATAACDEDRTAALLGFIAGAGFEQVLLVTHESASEAIADNVIQL